MYKIKQGGAKMSLSVKVQKKSTTGYTATVPMDVAKHLGLCKGDILQYVIRDDGTVEARKGEKDKRWLK